MVSMFPKAIRGESGRVRLLKMRSRICSEMDPVRCGSEQPYISRKFESVPQRELVAETAD